MLKKILAMLLAFVMMLSLTACGGNKPAEPDDDGNRQERVTEEPKKTEEPEETAEPEETEEPAETEEPTEEPTKEPAGVSADFKAAMDKYEAFIDEYITFIKKYEEEGKPASMLADYAKMMTQYSEFAAAMAEYESEELSDADAAYLIQVNARVQAKLLTLN